MKTVLPIERSRTKLPVAWEQGGGATNTGNAIVICGPDGSPLKPIYVAKHGSLSNGKHALFVVAVGCIVIEVSRHRDEYTRNVYKIVAIEEEDKAVLFPIAFYTEATGWVDVDKPTMDALQQGPIHNAICAANSKSECYHCRLPHYAAQDFNL